MNHANIPRHVPEPARTVTSHMFNCSSGHWYRLRAVVRLYVGILDWYREDNAGASKEFVVWLAGISQVV